MEKNFIMEKFENKLLVTATLLDLAETLKMVLGFSGHEVSNRQPEVKRYVYGMKGLAQILGCSVATAQRIKSSGRLDKAISQDGRIIVVDVELALELMKVK